MKRFSFILIVSTLVAFANKESQELMLSKRQAGAIAINMSIDEVYSIVKKENTKLVDLFLEATFSPAIVVYNKKGESSLVIDIECSKVWRINVYDRAFHTKENISVGSTFGDLKKHYKISSIEIGETDVFAYVEELDMSFCLGYIKTFPRELKVQDIGNEVRILKILIL